MQISQAFHSGNIRVLRADSPRDIDLEIRTDAGGEHLQWFHYRVTGARGQDLTMRLGNAKSTSYPTGWVNYRAFCGEVDDQGTLRWTRVPTDFDGGALIIQHTPRTDCAHYAYFEPYSDAQQQLALARWAAHPQVTVKVLGQTLDGADMELVSVGDVDSGRPVVWAIGRQHPGETMAQWWMQGFLDRLLSDDPLAVALREQLVFQVVPNMNPDGSRRGHLRTNACGANLNREWHAPTVTRSPEVLYVLQEMDRTGVQLCLDVHGDEALPVVFLDGAEGTPGWTDALLALQDRFKQAYLDATDDFQVERGYPLPAPGQANLTMCTNQVSQRFGCLALTLEQPFKELEGRPGGAVDWAGDHCAQAGAAMLGPIHAVLADLEAHKGSKR